MLLLTDFHFSVSIRSVTLSHAFILWLIYTLQFCSSPRVAIRQNFTGHVRDFSCIICVREKYQKVLNVRNFKV